MYVQTTNFNMECKIVERETYCDPTVASLQSLLIERLIQIIEIHLKQQKKDGGFSSNRVSHNRAGYFFCF